MILLEDLRFVLYVRKSTESSDRQVQSLDDQLNLMKEVAQKRGVTIVKVISESKSAKTPNSRDGFNQMLELIEAGQIDGIISYAFDRLSRNPVDSANIKWLLQSEKLKRIITNTRDYLPEDNALLLSIEDGMANEYIRKLRRDVRRGMTSKFNKGIYPGQAPIGYRNCPYDRDIKMDEYYFPIIQKMWRMLLSEQYQVPEIHRIAVEKWNLKSPRSKRTNGPCISKSLVYSIFHNPFYMGVINWAGMTTKGNHEVMVSPDEFEQVQNIIKNYSKDHSYKHKHVYTGIMRCPDCGCQITAETKVKKGKRYTYYFCSGRTKFTPCKRKKTRIKKEQLEDQISNLLVSLNITESYYEEAISHIENEKHILVQEKKLLQEGQEKMLLKVKKRKNKMMDLLLDDVLSAKDYKVKMKEISSEIAILKTKLQSFKSIDDTMNTAIRAFSFLKFVQNNFQKGDSDLKKTIFKSLGRNHTLKDGKLSLDIAPWLKIIQGFHYGSEHEKRASELCKGSPRKEILDFSAKSSLWYTTVKRVWKIICTQSTPINIPEIK